MEKYRYLLSNDGAEVERLVSGKTSVEVNAPMALIECGVQAQVRLLIRLYDKGFLRLDNHAPDKKPEADVMVWRGKELKSMGDMVDAMTAVRSEATAKQFVIEYMKLATWKVVSSNVRFAASRTTNQKTGRRILKWFLGE
jgi:hypothetical protein